MLGAGGYRDGSRLTTCRPLTHTAGVLRLPLAPGALRGGGELAFRGLEQRQGGRPLGAPRKEPTASIQQECSHCRGFPQPSGHWTHQLLRGL